jgi:uncharacterized protein YecE (DUF72 family)
MRAISSFIERLRDVAISAGIEARHAVAFAAERSEHQDGHGRIAAQELADCMPSTPGSIRPRRPRSAEPVAVHRRHGSR